MINRRNFLTTVAMGAASAAFLAACGQSSSAGQTGSAENPVTITYTWWGNDDRAERTRKAIALFESKNPDIKVNGNFTDFNGYWQKRATEAAGGGLPDVMQWDLSYLRDYGQRNQLLDLSTVKINTDAFDKSLLPSGQIRGKTFGIPTSTNAFAVYYDPAKLKSLGIAEPDGSWNYKEFNAFLTEVGSKGNGTLFGGTDYTGVWWNFNIWLRQNNIQAFTDEGKLGFSKDDLKKWWNLAADLRGTGAIVGEDKVTQLLPKSPFGSNVTATEVTWDNFMAGYLADSGAKELKLVPVPSDDPDNLGLFLKPPCSWLPARRPSTRTQPPASSTSWSTTPRWGRSSRPPAVFRRRRPSATAPRSKARTSWWWITRSPSRSTSKMLPSRRSSVSAPWRLPSSASVLN